MSASQAVETLNGCQIASHRLKVSFAKVQRRGGPVELARSPPARTLDDLLPPLHPPSVVLVKNLPTVLGDIIAVDTAFLYSLF